MFQPSEIVHAAFPFTDLTTSKRRPCLVLAVCDSPDDFVPAFITTSSAPVPSAHSVAVGPSHAEWRRTGLKQPSLIRADKLTTLHLSVISAIGFCRMISCAWFETRFGNCCARLNRRRQDQAVDGRAEGEREHGHGGEAWVL